MNNIKNHDYGYPLLACCKSVFDIKITYTRNVWPIKFNFSERNIPSDILGLLYSKLSPFDWYTLALVSCGAWHGYLRDYPRKTQYVKNVLKSIIDIPNADVFHESMISVPNTDIRYTSNQLRSIVMVFQALENPFPVSLLPDNVNLVLTTLALIYRNDPDEMAGFSVSYWNNLRYMFKYLDHDIRDLYWSLFTYGSLEFLSLIKNDDIAGGMAGMINLGVVNKDVKAWIKSNFKASANSIRDLTNSIDALDSLNILDYPEVQNYVMLEQICVDGDTLAYWFSNGKIDITWLLDYLDQFNLYSNGCARLIECLHENGLLTTSLAIELFTSFHCCVCHECLNLYNPIFHKYLIFSVLTVSYMRENFQFLYQHYPDKLYLGELWCGIYKYISARGAGALIKMIEKCKLPLYGNNIESLKSIKGKGIKYYRHLHDYQINHAI